MAFLDNSGDIILDAVLTDEGRKVLSKGDGTFRITKFALGDEEINYELYNPNHASGSAYYDLEILQTPVLESFTNNASSMKTSLVSYADDLLYLPVLKLNQNLSETKMHASGAFMVAVNVDTQGQPGSISHTASVGINGTTIRGGFLFGATQTSPNYIRVDQGIDSSEVDPSATGMMANLTDDFYTVQMDNRLGSLYTTTNPQAAAYDFIDDDNIAFYTVGTAPSAGGGTFVSDNTVSTPSATETIAGPRGTILEFKIGASQDLTNSTFLFTKLGGTAFMLNKQNNNSSVYYIDSTVRVTGRTSGYSLDIPVRFVRTII